MELVKTAAAGTLESSDVMVTLGPGNAGIEIELTSTVEKQFGKQIRKVVEETLSKANVKNVRIQLNDRGALDCTIRARVEAALYRAAGSTDYKWGE